jgi:hypothetical protein
VKGGAVVDCVAATATDAASAEATSVERIP